MCNSSRYLILSKCLGYQNRKEKNVPVKYSQRRKNINCVACVHMHSGLEAHVDSNSALFHQRVYKAAWSMYMYVRTCMLSKKLLQNYFLWFEIFDTELLTNLTE